MFEELQSIETIKAEALAGGALPEGASGFARQSEAMADAIDRIVVGLQRADQAAQMLDRAIGESTAFATALERIYPGWQEVVVKLQPLLRKLRQEIAAGDFEHRALELRGQAVYLLSRAVADQGFAEWASSLPPETEPIVDDADIQPVHWDAAQGWLEGAG
jgi:hypothetical protein